MDPKSEQRTSQNQLALHHQRRQNQTPLPLPANRLNQGTRRVYVIGTCDTKAAELGYACDRVRAAGADPVLVDVSTGDTTQPADVAAAEIAASHPEGADAVLGSNTKSREI
ncbi:Tm-1-like ATP-binding domain-containing protein [Roseinatronobacter monicus]|uniref:Tm-1-like ATP-binding domain-containing protein n=1 Tax=Roseinatronobacter monicus TaxID=393481 RepID=UPI001BA61990|nr:Tm-1-like ATP-binding domain-containing protein [Roseinatronobacter monicus]